MDQKLREKIVGVLTEGKQILDLYVKCGCHRGHSKDSYRKFLYEVGKLLLNMKHHDYKFTMEWLYTQEFNTLKYPSSGSTLVALEDIDNFDGAIFPDGEYDDEAYEFFKNVYKGLFTQNFNSYI